MRVLGLRGASRGKVSDDVPPTRPRPAPENDWLGATSPPALKNPRWVADFNRHSMLLVGVYVAFVIDA